MRSAWCLSAATMPQEVRKPAAVAASRSWQIPWRSTGTVLGIDHPRVLLLATGFAERVARGLYQLVCNGQCFARAS